MAVKPDVVQARWVDEAQYELLLCSGDHQEENCTGDHLGPRAFVRAPLRVVDEDGRQVKDDGGVLMHVVEPRSRLEARAQRVMAGELEEIAAVRARRDVAAETLMAEPFRRDAEPE